MRTVAFRRVPPRDAGPNSKEEPIQHFLINPLFGALPPSGKCSLRDAPLLIRCVMPVDRHGPATKPLRAISSNTQYHMQVNLCLLPRSPSAVVPPLSIRCRYPPNVAFRQ